MFIKEIALDLTVFTLSNVNDAISFKPQLCFEVPKQDYQALKENYINFTGTSIRKNRSRLYFLPTNVSDELQKLNPSIPEGAKMVPNDGRVYYKNRLISELDYENVKRVETACAFIAYTALNSFVHFETESSQSKSSYSIQGKASSHIAHNLLHNSNQSRSNSNNSSNGNGNGNGTHENGASGDDDDGSPTEGVSKALRKGNILGFRELGHLVGITPWHFHRVFKVITGLTIREYGQLCVEFIKKNQEIIDTCKIKVEQIKSKQHFSCLDDEDFLKDGSIQYAATEDVVLLHEYFIDPNKSKEFKTRKNSNSNSTAGDANNSASNNSNSNSNSKSNSTLIQNDNISTVNRGYTSNYGPNSNSIPASNIVPNNIPNTDISPNAMTAPVQPFARKTYSSSEQLSNLQNSEELSPTSQRSEIRKRRSSVMYGRMQRAAQNSITSNSLLYECLTSPPGDLKLSEYCLTNGCNDMEANDLDNGDETDTSGTSSVWEHQNNMFPPAQATRSASPSITSRKNSIISFGNVGVADVLPKSQTNQKISKRKSISSGTNMDALQNSMLHRRNKSDGGSMGLNMDPYEGELSLDSRLSLSPREYPIEFNSNVFNNLQSPIATTTGTNVTNMNPREEDDILGGDIANGFDFRVNDGQIPYNLMNIPNAVPLDHHDSSNNNNIASMTDISLFDNSLMDQPSVSNADSGINSIMDNSGFPLQMTPQQTTTNKEQDIQLDAILNDSNILYDGGGLTPSATSILNAMDNGKLMADLGSMVSGNTNSNTNESTEARNFTKNTSATNNFRATPTMVDSKDPVIKPKDQSENNYFFNAVSSAADDDAGLLFDTGGLLSTNDSFVPRDTTNLHRTTTANAGNTSEHSAYDF